MISSDHIHDLGKFDLIFTTFLTLPTAFFFPFLTGGTTRLIKLNSFERFITLPRLKDTGNPKLPRFLLFDLRGETVVVVVVIDLQSQKSTFALLKYIKPAS